MQYVSIKDLKKNPNNPRIVKNEEFSKLKDSLRDEEGKKHFEARPVIVSTRTGENIIIAGNTRFQAAKELGWQEIPTVIIHNLTEEREKEIIIRDNVNNGEWDMDTLYNEWDAGQLLEWGLELPEVTTLDEEAQEDDYEMPDTIETTIVKGDLIEIGEHRLLCGDSTTTDTYAKLFETKLADLVITDPPYNVDYEGGTGLKIMNDKMDNNTFYQFLYDFYTALGSYTKKGGVWYVFHADSEGVNFRTAYENSGLLLKQCLIWVKNSLVMGRQDYQWKHEPILYGWKAGAGHYFTEERHHTTVIEDTININKLSKYEMKRMLTDIISDKTKSTVIRADKPIANDVHPTMKPILLIAPLIENSSRVGEIVADGFLGSGSTMVASHQLGRICYGMELDPKYCQVIIDRMKKLDPSLVVKINGQNYE